jgi:DOMON domain
MSELRVGTVAIAVVLLAGIGGAASAQDTLRVSSRRPTVDGTVTRNEYSYSRDFDQQLTLYASRTPTTLYLAVVANTAGWVGVGLGSPRMDGADIFMGFVRGGKAIFKPQVGRGHSHRDAPKEVKTAVESYALRERGGKTTLEVALKASAYIRRGQPSLDMIFAMGDRPSFTMYHSYRGATSLTLAE